MLENEFGIETVQEIDNLVDYSVFLKEHLTTVYPQLILPTPINSFDVNSKKFRMSDNEREFAKLLLTRDLIVYREPTIKDCTKVPDFFVYNPRTDNGKLVEITLYPSTTHDERKTEQVKALAMTGIPLVVLYKEHMENIKRYCCDELF